MKKSLSLFLSVIMLLSAFSTAPISSFAYDLYDGKSYSETAGYPQFIVDRDNDEYWVVSENVWHSCIYNDNKRLDNLISSIQQTMYNREESFNAYFIVRGKYADSFDELDSDKCIKEIYEYICEEVYRDKSLPYGGDYLEMLTLSITCGTRSGILVASSRSDEYTFFRIQLNFTYMSNAAQEQNVNNYLKKWNELFIENNERISSSEGETRKYYIVKTIYNFLAKNTVYDINLYNDVNHTAYPVDGERYRVSHTAYGALMGNIRGSFNDEFDYNTCSFEYVRDYQQLFRIHMMNQGRSVCDGYTLVFYYLCKLNGIDCRIVTGDYISGHEKGSDPHAWNEVYLKDQLDRDYEWYSVDVTFGSQCTQKIADDYTFVDYEFFLRGTGNDNFSKANHQQVYEEFSRAGMSPEDYRFSLQSVDLENARAIVTRRRVEDIHVKYISDGVYNLENYAITENSENNTHLWKIRKFKLVDGQEILVDEFAREEEGVEYIYEYVNAQDSFTYYGANDGYWYEYEIYDYARGVEYICADRKLKDAGDYYFDMYDPVSGSSVASRKLTISKLDMSNWKSYDKDLTVYSNEAYFSGSDIELLVDIVDSSHTKLEKGTDFTFFSYKNGDPDKTPVKPNLPGKYTIRVDYHGNYSGTIEFPFEVKKIDLSLYNDNIIEVQYGIDLEKTVSLNVKDNNGNTFDFEKNKDYTIKVNGGSNYLDEGTITITALRGSEYLEAGTVKVWKYVVNKRLDLTSVFRNNNVIRDEKHTYTGNRITPTDFRITYTKGDGTTVELVKNRDYRIIGYGENIDAGFGTVNVEFVGNYEGSASLQFLIEKPVKFNVSVSDLTYNGKTQIPNVKVTYNGRELVEGNDYNISGEGREPGFYTVIVTGINNFSRVSGKYTFMIKPSAVKSLKKSAATSSALTLTWSSQGGIASYQVYAYDSGKKVWSKIAQTNTNTCKINAVYYNGKKTALQDATKYSFKVRAFFSAKVNDKPITEYGAFTSINAYTLPKTPTIKSVTKGKTTIKCSWAKNTKVTGYQLVIATNSSFTAGKKTVKLSSNKTTAYTFKSLKKGKTYYIKLRAYKTVGTTTIYSTYSTVKKVKL